MPFSKRRLGVRLGRVAAALAIVGVITLIDLLISNINHTTIALTLLMGVLAVAAKWGLVEAVAASLASMLGAAYFFLPPVGDIAIEDPQNWVAVAAFLIVSVVASQLSAGARKKACEAMQRQTELEQLNEFSQSLMLTSTRQETGREIADQSVAIFHLLGAAFYDLGTGAVYRSGHAGAVTPDSELRRVAGGTVTVESDGIVICPVGTAAERVGSIAMAGANVSRVALESIAHVVAVAFKRAETHEAARRADAVRQSQELKSVMLDAMAHGFKTPLTSIKFGATVLRSDHALSARQQEVLTVIEEEADRMTGMITEAIQVARIEAGDIELTRAPQSTVALVAAAVSRLHQTADENPVRIDPMDSLPAGYADATLMPIALAHLLDNACKYSPDGCPVTVSASSDENEVVISVSDRGPGISPGEQRFVFERFYRGAAGKQTEGAGMGLAIVAEIVRLHNGRVWVDNVRDGGARFSLSLPVADAVQND
jgi:two-component system sensor histidine kinase KdpD